VLEGGIDSSGIRCVAEERFDTFMENYYCSTKLASHSLSAQTAQFKEIYHRNSIRKGMSKYSQ
jgi:hypothetical protein